MRKKRKKRIKNPPLSLLDKIIYFIFWCLLIIVPFGLLLFFKYLRDHIFMNIPNVIAYSEETSNLLIIPFLLFIMILFGVIADSKHPIFGNKTIHYGEAPWRDVYPLLWKEKPKKKLNTYKRKQRRTGILIVSFLFLFVLSLGFFSFYGRSQILDNGTIEVYGTVNQLKESYRIDDIKEMTIKTYFNFNYHSYSYWSFAIVIKMTDGKKFFYDYSDFRNLENMVNFKELISLDKIVILGTENMDRVIDHYDFSKEELKSFYQLFSETKTP